MMKISKAISYSFLQPQEKNSFSIKKYFEGNFIYEFPMGRDAFYELIKHLISKKNNKKMFLLIPKLICYEVVECVRGLNVEILFYDLDENLNPKNLHFFESQKIDLILCVNYFGFPSDIKLFNDLAIKTNSKLCEDNAHGFLSSYNGEKLGTRADFSLFSFRKTVSVPDGAILLSRENLNLILQTRFSEIPIGFKIKNLVRHLVGIFGTKNFVKLLRIKRKRIIQNDIVKYKPSLNSEYTFCEYEKLIQSIDLESEVQRRRDLYKFLRDYLGKYEIKSIFNELPDGIVPYAYPFIILNYNKLDKINDDLNSLGLEMFKWPQLPEETKSEQAAIYKSLYFVRFLW